MLVEVYLQSPSWENIHLEGTPGHQMANFTQLGAQKILSWLGEKVQIFQK